MDITLKSTCYILHFKPPRCVVFIISDTVSFRRLPLVLFDFNKLVDQSKRSVRTDLKRVSHSSRSRCSLARINGSDAFETSSDHQANFCLVSVVEAFHCISANHFSNHAAVFLIFAWIFPTLQAATSVHLLEPSVKINFYKDLKHAWVCIITEDLVSAGILHGCIDAINMQISRWCIQMKRWSSFEEMQAVAFG